MANIFVVACLNLRTIFKEIPLLLDIFISNYSNVVLAPLRVGRSGRLPEWPSPFTGPDERFVCIHQTIRRHILEGLNKMQSVNIPTRCHPILNPSDAELNPICHMLALFGVHHILHVSG